MIRTETSIIVYRFVVYTDISLKQFIFNQPNCICTFKNKWRVTYHGIDYSMNIFMAKKLSKPAMVCMVFSKPKPIENFFPEFEKLFGARPDINNITFINRVEKFYTNFTELDFEGLYEDLDNSTDISTFFIIDHSKKKEKSIIKSSRLAKIPSYSEKPADSDETPVIVGNCLDNVDPHLSMDLQRFCAMIVQPFPEESNVTIEIFASGVLNVAGIPSEDYFQRIKQFIEEKLAPLLEKNSSTYN